jgi:adenylate cyclase, class 2
VTYEVEQKYAVADAAALLARLQKLGVTLEPPVAQRDHYFNHPARDFAQTDEAFRLRQSGASSFVTYKGPKIDATTKTRREIELPLPTGAADSEAWPALLQALGFRSVADVRKHRRKGTLRWKDFEVEFVLDEVAEVGTFCELELQAEESGLAAAKQCLAELAKELNLSTPERRSYLEMLLEQR